MPGGWSLIRSLGCVSETMRMRDDYAAVMGEDQKFLRYRQDDRMRSRLCLQSRSSLSESILDRPALDKHLGSDLALRHPIGGHGKKLRLPRGESRDLFDQLHLTAA